MITPETMSRDDMEWAAKNEVCGECGGSLSVAWGGVFGINGHILRCSNIEHSTITRHNKQSNYEKQIEKEFREVHKMDSTALTTMSEKGMMERISSAKFPTDLTIQDKKVLALAAITYGFDPIMGEISIYQGRPYVSIDGRYRKAQETDKLDGVKTRPATKDERAEWNIPDGDYFFKSEVYVKGTRFPFEGWGRVFSRETQGGKGYKPVETNPQRMAEKRAEAQALRKAFHINLPSIEEAGSPLEMAEQIVDASTGEIIIPGATPSPIQQASVSPVPEKIPQTKQELMNWVYSHKGCKATVDQVASWITNPVTNVPYKKIETLPDNPESIAAAYGEIKNVNGWID